MSSSSHGGERPTGDSTAHQLPTLGVVIVAAGRGERLGANTPKAFIELGERTLFEHALRTVAHLPIPGQAVLVVPDGYAAQALEIADAAISAGAHWQASVVPGGRERHESVRNGLAALHDSIETVLIHDAARPLTPTAVFERVISEVHRTGDGVVPTIPVADTLKRLDGDGVVTSTVDRTALAAVQTPQGFRRERIEAAHESAQLREDAQSSPPTDDAEVLQRFGGIVRTVAGDQRGQKVTTPTDLLFLQCFLTQEDEEDAATRVGRGNS